MLIPLCQCPLGALKLLHKGRLLKMELTFETGLKGAQKQFIFPKFTFVAGYEVLVVVLDLLLSSSIVQQI